MKAKPQPRSQRRWIRANKKAKGVISTYPHFNSADEGGLILSTPLPYICKRFNVFSLKIPKMVPLFAKKGIFKKSSINHNSRNPETVPNF